VRIRIVFLETVGTVPVRERMARSVRETHALHLANALQGVVMLLEMERSALRNSSTAGSAMRILIACLANVREGVGKEGGVNRQTMRKIARSRTGSPMNRSKNTKFKVNIKPVLREHSSTTKKKD